MVGYTLDLFLETIKKPESRAKVSAEVLLKINKYHIKEVPGRINIFVKTY